MSDVVIALLAVLGAIWLAQCVFVSIVLCAYDRVLNRKGGASAPDYSSSSDDFGARSDF